MLKNLENIFIWACSIMFIAAALCTVALWMAGLFAYVTGHLNG